MMRDVGLFAEVVRVNGDRLHLIIEGLSQYADREKRFYEVELVDHVQDDQICEDVSLTETDDNNIL